MDLPQGMVLSLPPDLPFKGYSGQIVIVSLAHGHGSTVLQLSIYLLRSHVSLPTIWPML